MAKIKFISIEQLLELMENKKEFKLVEVLLPEEYKRFHIPNAINIPVHKIKDEAGKHLKKDDTIVVYCGSYTCNASTTAVKELLKLGYKNVYDFKAGKYGWRHAGLVLVK